MTKVVAGETGCVVAVTVVCRRLDATQQPMTMQVTMGIITKSTKDEIDPPTAGPTTLPGEGIMNSQRVSSLLQDYVLKLSPEAAILWCYRCFHNCHLNTSFRTLGYQVSVNQSTPPPPSPVFIVSQSGKF